MTGDDVADKPDKDVTLRRDTVHAVISHLHVVLGLVHLILEDTPDDGQRRQDLLEVRQAAEKAAALLHGSMQSS
jgi:hypothetical protein